MASVDLERVEKVYPDGVHAVVDCTLGIADGELLALVGPSGCGKSTLLRLIAGLEPLTAGTLRISGAVVNDLSPQARNVAMVFQDYALYPHMTVRKNLEFPLRMRRLTRGEVARRVLRVARLLDLAPLMERLPKQLSGGQRQRVAMGRALVREPTVSLLDEPLSNLDAQLRAQVRAEIGDLQRRTGTTMLYVTHDQVEAMTLGARVAVMHRGRLQQIAAPQEIYDRPANTFVAGFIGNPAMNLIPTRLLRAADDRCAVPIGGGTVPIPSDRFAVADLRPHIGQPLTAGIRPEALRLTTDPGTGETIGALVAYAEWLGHETLVHLQLMGSDTALVARLPGMHAWAKDDAVGLAIDGRALHLFTPDGESVPLKG